MRTRPYRLAVILFEEMDLLDVAAPLEVLSTAGRKWNFRAVKAQLLSTSQATLGTRAQVQLGPAEPLGSCPDPELLLVPGGYGARVALQDPALIAYLESLRDQLTLTLSVGLGSLVAARAGLLNGCEVAATPSLCDELVALDPTLIPRRNARTVSGPRSITAAQGGAALELGLEVVARLLGNNQAAATARELGYPWGVEVLAVEIKP